MTHSIKTFLLSLLCLVSALYADQPFVVGELTGQLGNQFFVIATTVSLALDHNATPVFPDLVNRQVDNTPLNYQKIFFRLNASLPSGACVSTYYKEPHFQYAPIVYIPNMCLRGYFQSEKYFRHHKKEIVELFQPHPEIAQYLQAKYGQLLSHPNTVAVHLRSYLDHDPHQTIYPLCGRHYFEKAMALFPHDALFLVFSNDMALCKREFEGISGNIHFIEGEAHYHDFYLMSMCKHNIICNSSFSWWSAYLNPNPDKIVIAPSVWFTKSSGINSSDLIPDEWVVLSE